MDHDTRSYTTNNNCDQPMSLLSPTLRRLMFCDALSLNAGQKLLLVLPKESNYYAVHTSNAPNNRVAFLPSYQHHIVRNSRSYIQIPCTVVSNPTGPKLLSGAESDDDKKRWFREGSGINVTYDGTGDDQITAIPLKGELLRWNIMFAGVNDRELFQLWGYADVQGEPKSFRESLINFTATHRNLWRRRC